MTTLKNSVHLIGRLGMDPETSTFGENKTKVKFSLATSNYYKDNKYYDKYYEKYYIYTMWQMKHI